MRGTSKKSQRHHQAPSELLGLFFLSLPCTLGPRHTVLLVSTKTGIVYFLLPRIRTLSLWNPTHSAQLCLLSDSLPETQLELSSVSAFTTGICIQVFLLQLVGAQLLFVKLNSVHCKCCSYHKLSLISSISRPYHGDRMQIFWSNSWDYQLCNRELNGLLASWSYLPCCLKRCCSIHGFISMCAVEWFLFPFFRMFPLHMYFCCICHQSTLTSGCTLIHLAFFKLLSLCFIWEKWLPSFLSSHFLNFIPGSADVRAALQKGARCHGKLAPLWAPEVESVSYSSQPLINVPDIVPRVLMEINSLDGDANLWYPMVLLHVHTVNRIFLNCFPNWDEIFGNQVEHFM